MLYCVVCFGGWGSEAGLRDLCGHVGEVSELQPQLPEVWFGCLLGQSVLSTHTAPPAMASQRSSSVLFLRIFIVLFLGENRAPSLRKILIQPQFLILLEFPPWPAPVGLGVERSLGLVVLSRTSGGYWVGPRELEASRAGPGSQARDYFYFSGYSTWSGQPCHLFRSLPLPWQSLEGHLGEEQEEWRTSLGWG